MPQTILVVDDERGICDNLAAYLEDEGLRVHTAQSGEEALRRIGAGLMVQICVVDLRLPGISGVDTILAIHRQAPKMRFIIHTGSEDDAVAATLQQAGMGLLPVFRKPLVDVSGLARVLKADCEGF